MKRVSSLLFAILIINIVFAQKVSLKTFHKQCVKKEFLSYKVRKIMCDTANQKYITNYEILQKNEKNNSIFSITQSDYRSMKLDNYTMI